MNRLEQALHCLQKVFALKTRLRALREQRPFARIDAPAVLVCLLLGVFTRGSSYLDLAQQTQRRRWRRLCGLKEAVGDDLFGYVTERLDSEDLRQGLAGCVKTLKQNKALQSCKINGRLFLSLAVRVVRSEEQWTETRQRGGRRRGQVRQSLWVRAASGKLDGYPAGMIYQGGHRRWGIENKAFNELTQSYHLDHCYHHEGASMLAQRLILLWGFLLFNAFAPLQSKLLALGKITTKALARQLNLALEEDRTWEQWCQSG
jgi:hypothetical protein